MVTIEPGEFYISAPPLWQGRPFGLGPMRKVIIEKSFSIAIYEVTIREWETCVTDGACKSIKNEYSTNDNFPAVNISWVEAVKFTKWLSAKSNYKYRLPSEAEWEYAARAGSGRSRFFDLKVEDICKYANVYDAPSKKQLGYEWESVECNDNFVRAAPVGTFLPNKFGLFDMLGNVWEWVEDCQSSLGTRHMGLTSGPVLRGDCSQRAYRGGSWLSHSPKYIRPPDRYKYKGTRQLDLGFRVIRENETP